MGKKAIAMEFGDYAIEMKSLESLESVVSDAGQRDDRRAQPWRSEILRYNSFALQGAVDWVLKNGLLAS
jgi:hypothetical protein